MRKCGVLTKFRRRGTPVYAGDRVVEKGVIVDLGLNDYAEVYKLQQILVAGRRDGVLVNDLFLVTEHHSVFTLGRRGGAENLVVSKEFLLEKNIQIVQIERGGDITYHGPGQLVVYPIIDLRKAGLGVTDYVYMLEEVMVKLAAGCDVDAVRDSRNHGVWVAGKKLGSVGIAIRHGITFHGFAFNVNLSLTPFSWVNPCGLQGVVMTSLSRERGQSICMDQVKFLLAETLSGVFSAGLQVETEEYLNVAM